MIGSSQLEKALVSAAPSMPKARASCSAAVDHKEFVWDTARPWKLLALKDLDKKRGVCTLFVLATQTLRTRSNPQRPLALLASSPSLYW